MLETTMRLTDLEMIKQLVEGGKPTYLEVHKLDSPQYQALKRILDRDDLPFNVLADILKFVEWFSDVDQALLTFCETGSDVLINPSDRNLNSLSAAQEDLEKLLKGEQ